MHITVLLLNATYFIPLVLCKEWTLLKIIMIKPYPSIQPMGNLSFKLQKNICNNLKKMYTSQQYSILNPSCTFFLLPIHI